MEQKFGFTQITSITPSWAKWLFRIVFFLNKIVAGYIAATNLISPEAKYEVTLFLVLIIDPLAFGFSKMFGIAIEDKPFPVADDGPGGSNPPPDPDDK